MTHFGLYNGKIGGEWLSLFTWMALASKIFLGPILRNSCPVKGLIYTQTIVVIVDATHRPVEFFHLHARIADYFDHGGQRFQNFGLQPTKWIKLLVSLKPRTSNRLMCGI